MRLLLTLVILLVTGCSSSIGEITTPADKVSENINENDGLPTESGSDPDIMDSTDEFQWPPRRGYSQLVYVSKTNSLVLFGGETNSRGSLFDTWIYDLKDDSWKEILTDLAPSNVGGSTAAYDIESGKIIFFFTVRNDSSAPAGLVGINQTWSFDPITLGWEKLNPEVSPEGLMGSRMVYDSESDRIILFGGADFTAEQTTTFSQTWSYDFNSNSWVELRTNVSPPGRSYHGMAYSPQTDLTYVYGGRLADQDQNGANDLWGFDFETSSWSKVEADGQATSDHHPFMVAQQNGKWMYYSVGTELYGFDTELNSWELISKLPDNLKLHFHGMAFADKEMELFIFGGGPQGLRYSDDLVIYDFGTSAWKVLNGIP